MRKISKPHAYLQTMTKPPVKFQKNRYTTVGGVAPTRYLLLYGDGRTDGRKDGEAKTKSLHFSSKRRETINLLKCMRNRVSLAVIIAGNVQKMKPVQNCTGFISRLYTLGAALVWWMKLEMQDRFPASPGCPI